MKLSEVKDPYFQSISSPTAPLFAPVHAMREITSRYVALNINRVKYHRLLWCNKLDDVNTHLKLSYPNTVKTKRAVIM